MSGLNMSNLEICKIVLSGDFEKFNEYVKENPEHVQKSDESGRSCLHWAAYIGSVDMIILILNYDNQIDRIDELGWTALTISVSAGRHDAVVLLLNKGANVNHMNNNGQSCLHYAVSKDRFDIATLLLTRGADINVQDFTSKTTPLHRAVSKSSISMTKLLLENKAKVNVPDIQGNTVLHYACEDGELELVTELLKWNADSTIKNKDGQLPIDLTKGKSKSIIKSLMA